MQILSKMLKYFKLVVTAILIAASFNHQLIMRARSTTKNDDVGIQF